jgi:hypothetical protein
MGEPQNADSPASAGGQLSMSAWCIVAAFGTYFCMYAFRKPFTAASYQNIDTTKTILVIAQTLGYMLSKFLGIKIVAEAQPNRRAMILLSLIAGAELALLLFAVTPFRFTWIWLFFNGVFLGMVFGLVLGFLEGRRQTEALIAGLCTSFILADGFTKTVGAYLLRLGVSEHWMPAAAGLLFAPPLVLFVWMLTRIPAPSPEDIAARSARKPMSGAQRGDLVRRYAFGLFTLVLSFVLVTILRSVRADFAREIWSGLGVDVLPGVFSWPEIVVAAGVLILSGSVVFLRHNRSAFFAAMAMAVCGPFLIGIALAGLSLGTMSPYTFMILVGLGLYLPYIAVHTTLFERLIAMTRERGNIGFLMQLADSFGYLGYVVVLLSHNLLGSMDDFLGFFIALCWVIAGASLVFLLLCWRYFAIHPALAAQR